MSRAGLLIFRTSIRARTQLKSIADLLNKFPQIKKWNVDFDDREKILRIEGEGLTASEISETLQTVNIRISELE